MSDPTEGKRSSTPTPPNAADENQTRSSSQSLSSFGDMSTIYASNLNLNCSRQVALRKRKEENTRVKNQEDVFRLNAELAIGNSKENSKNTQDIDAEIEKLEKEIEYKEILLEKASIVEKLLPLIKKAEEYNKVLDETKKKLINGSSLRPLKHQNSVTEQDINLKNVEKNLQIIQNNLPLYEAENPEVADIIDNANKLINENLSTLNDFEKWTIHHKAASILYDQIKSEENSKEKEANKNSNSETN